MKLMEYALTPAQYKRANILVAKAINLVYAVFIILVWTTDQSTVPMKVLYTGILVAWYVITAISVVKLVEKNLEC